MSEFKFACPVCGQHITADSSSSGGQLECPTCFQKIVVPQGRKDSKFILAASQVSKPRPTSATADLSGPKPAREPSQLLLSILLAVVVLGIGAAVYLFRDKLFGSHSQTPEPVAKATVPSNTPPPLVEHPVPTNIAWTLELTNAVIPESTASGNIHGAGFLCESATLQGGNLTLREGKSGKPDFGVTIRLFAEEGEQLSGKTIQITSNREPPLPKITLRWRNEQQQPQTATIDSGYAMKLAFGQPANGRMPGKIYICLPDEEKSFIAGTFEARIRKPSQKQRS